MIRKETFGLDRLWEEWSFYDVEKEKFSPEFFLKIKQGKMCVHCMKMQNMYG